MLFQITHICFNEPDFVTLHTVMNIMAESRTKVTKHCIAMVFSYCNSLLLENGYYKRSMSDALVWLSCYVYIFAI